MLLVSRAGGDWQFLCGGDDHPEDEEPHLVCAQHLFDRDRRLLELVDLQDDWDAERASVDAPWARSPTPPEGLEE